MLWGRPVRTRADMAACAEALAKDFGTAVLVKGGHLEDGSAADVLWAEGAPHWLEGERTPGVHTHGTGCSLSASIATCLGLGLSLREAVVRAKSYVAGAIRQHLAWQGGLGEVHALDHGWQARG